MPRDRWTADEDRTIRRDYLTAGAAALAERFGRTRGAVYLRAWKLRVIGRYPDAPSSPRFAERHAEFRRLHARGWSDEEIAARFGVTYSAIWQRRQRYGLPANTRSPRALARIRRRVRALCRAGHFGVRAWLRPVCEAYHLPPDLRLIQVRILLHLADGPLTRRQVLGRLGNRCENGATADLIRRGLVYRTEFSGRGFPRGQRPLPLYALTPHAMDLLLSAGRPS